MRPQINFLSREEENQIHRAALWLLSNVGMQFHSDETVGIMRKSGAKIEGNNVVKIPEELVNFAIEKAPKRESFVLYGQEEKYDIHIGQDAPVLSSFLYAINILDLETKERRLFTDNDLADVVRLMDALENFSINGALGTPQDVPKNTSEWYSLATVLKNTSKHIFSGAPGAQFVKDAVEMASLVVGGEDKFRQRPFISFVILARCPLALARLSSEALVELSRQGLPVTISSGPILGMTAPVTLAAVLAQSHAELLAMLVLTQIVRPGTPVFYDAAGRAMDMKTARVSMASPEFSILKGASVQMGRYLGLPTRMPGLLRDAKILDAQAGFETGTVGLVTALSADVILGPQFDMDTLVDFADIVFSNEAMSALKRIARGLSVEENTLALNLIKEIGHGGSFLNNKHTLQNFRKEIWMPRLMERRDWARWYNDGHKNIEQRARETAREILSSYSSRQLPTEVKAKIDRIASKAVLEHSS